MLGRRVLILALGLACARSGRSRFPDRAPLLREPETPFSPVPDKNTRADRAAATDDLLFWEVDRALALEPRQVKAENVNSLDEVPDSSFFTNRIAWVTPEQVRHGGEVGAPIDVEHDLVVLDAKTEGVTGGLVVEDKSGTKFVLKLDPQGRYGLLTGTEAATGRLLWAAGYNVPDNRIALVEPSRFVPSKKKDAPNREQIARVLARTPRAPGGRVRVLASRYVDGEILGPMVWRGRRKGDPNDLVRHERRRELRGLRLLYVWVGNPDAKMNNSLDTYVAAPGGGLVRHYLLDFGTSLGAGGSGPASSGWWFRLAWRRGLSAEGVRSLRVRSAESDDARRMRREREDDPIGAGFPADVDAKKFRFIWRNPAFARMDRSDEAWAARILLGFDEARLRAAVEAAHWSPAVTKGVVERLLARRDAIVRQVFREASGLTLPAVVGRGVCATDLAAAYGLLATQVTVRGASSFARSGSEVCVAPERDGYHMIEIRTRPGGLLVVHVLAGGGRLRILGVERE